MTFKKADMTDSANDMHHSLSLVERQYYAQAMGFIKADMKDSANDMVHSPRIPIDWARPTLTALTPNGFWKGKSMRDLLDYLKSSWPNVRFTLIVEASYGSFAPGEKRADLEAIYAVGYRIRGFKSTLTEKQRRKWGIEKSDINDLVAILYIGRHHPTRVLSPDDETPEYSSRTRYILERKMGHINVKGEIKRLLPPFRSLVPECQLAFGDGSNYSMSIASLLVCAYQDPSSTNVKSFEKVVGLHGNALGVFRSTLIRRMYTDRASGILRVPKGRFQYWLRWMYHQMVKADIRDSANDMMHSP